MKKTQKIMIIAVICVSALLAVLLIQTRPQAIASKENGFLITVETVVAAPQSVTPVYTLSGRLQPLKVSDLEFEVEGQMVARNVEPGM